MDSQVSSSPFLSLSEFTCSTSIRDFNERIADRLCCMPPKILKILVEYAEEMKNQMDFKSEINVYALPDNLRNAKKMALVYNAVKSAEGQSTTKQTVKGFFYPMEDAEIPDLVDYLKCTKEELVTLAEHFNRIGLADHSDIDEFRCLGEGEDARELTGRFLNEQANDISNSKFDIRSRFIMAFWGIRKLGNIGEVAIKMAFGQLQGKKI